MTKFSLNSHHKKIRIAINIALGFILFYLGVNLSLSIVLNKKLADIRSFVSQVSGISFDLKFAYFNLFKGIGMSGLEFSKDSHVLFVAERADVGFDLLSLLKHEIRIKNIDVRNAHVYANKFSDMAYLLKDAYRKMGNSIGFFKTTYFKWTDLELEGLGRLDMRGYCSFIREDLWISRGELLLKKIYAPAGFDFDFFQGSSFYKPLDYVLEAQTKGADCFISRCEFSNSVLKFSGKGRIRDFASNAFVDFEMNFINMFLDNFPSLNQERLRSGGVVDSVFQVMGPMTDLKSTLRMKVTNTWFNFFDSLVISGVNGYAIVTQDQMSSPYLSLSINGVPCVADFSVYQHFYPHLFLRLSSLSKVFDNRMFVLNLSADWIANELVGEAKTKVCYLTGETSRSVDFNLKDFHLGYEDDLFINAENLDIGFSAEPVEKLEESKISNRKINMEQFFCVLKKQKDGFALAPLKASCYNGTLEGEIYFIPQDTELIIKGEGHMREVDLELASLETPFVLQGKLDGDLRFDNSLTDIFKGQLFVTSGTVEQNPIINAVADFLGVASLKKISFDELSVFFSGGRGEYASQVKLRSPLVNGFLDTKISSFDKVDGYLSVSLATQLLNESKVFKKLLTYISHGEPFVIFPFKISSYIDSPRVLWLKNEFQEKLQNLLPERNKRFLQREVNKMVERIKVE